MLAVIDLGKTNAKILVFGPDGQIHWQARSAPQWIDHGFYRALDDTQLWLWINQSLAQAISRLPLSGIMLTTHGCTCALVGGDGLVVPILDYESPVPTEIEARFQLVAPPYDETFSPDLPLGLNFGKQIFWREQIDADVLACTDAILCYPQYWNWRFTGEACSEVSYIGCHTHLWAPARQDFSSLVDRQGWRRKFPAFKRAGSVMGEFSLRGEDGRARSLPVHNGVHDSNACLYFYRRLGFGSFSLISTGTWVIGFNTACPLTALDEDRDMLANVTVDGTPVATARFMGGREFDVISQQARCTVPVEALEAAISSAQFALPSFAPGGPFPDARGRLEGPQPDTEVARAAVASLYIACMMSTMLDLLQSQNTIIVDGGLANNLTLLGLLAALRPDQQVLRSDHAEGTAAGAAALAFESLGLQPFRDACTAVAPLRIQGLRNYVAEWTARAKALVEDGPRVEKV